MAFEAAAPNLKCFADFNYTWTAEEWLHVAALLTVFYWLVVGWTMKADLLQALSSWRYGRSKPELGASFGPRLAILRVNGSSAGWPTTASPAIVHEVPDHPAIDFRFAAGEFTLKSVQRDVIPAADPLQKPDASGDGRGQPLAGSSAPVAR